MRRNGIIYDLRTDRHHIKLIQQASLEKSPGSWGFKIVDNLLYGTREWFDAIADGRILKHVLKGRISRVYMAGHNDFPEFEFESGEEKTTWALQGEYSNYIPGTKVAITYVEQQFKRPFYNNVRFSKCIIEIKEFTGKD